MIDITNEPGHLDSPQVIIDYYNTEVVRRARNIVGTPEWSGDIRLNFNTLVASSRVLLQYVEKLEEKLKEKG